MPNNPHPYYLPYYPPPPSNPNYFFGGSNFKPSSTPTELTIGLTKFKMVANPNTDDGVHEEVVETQSLG